MSAAIVTPGKHRPKRSLHRRNAYSLERLFEELWIRQSLNGREPFRGEEHEERVMELKATLGIGARGGIANAP